MKSTDQTVAHALLCLNDSLLSIKLCVILCLQVCLQLTCGLNSGENAAEAFTQQDVTAPIILTVTASKVCVCLSLLDAFG